MLPISPNATPQVEGSASSSSQSSKTSEIDSRTALVRTRVAATIRTSFPIETLFNPTLKLDIGVFLKDQDRINQIAACLIPLTTQQVATTEEIAQHLAANNLQRQIEQMFTQDSGLHLHSLYQACLDVLNHQVNSHSVNDALQGRILL